MAMSITQVAGSVIASAATVILIVVPLLRPFVEDWLKAKIDVGVREQTERRMRMLQLDLDKDLDRHKGELTLQLEAVRGGLTRTGIDFRLYAERRHVAIARLYESYLAAETSGTDFSAIPTSTVTKLSEAEVDTLIKRYFNSTDSEAGEARRLWAAGVQDELGKLFQRAAQNQMLDQVIAAYKSAQSAYFAAAIYLPDDVDRAAIAVREQFTAVTVPHLIGGSELDRELQAAKIKLRFLMLEFQHAARAELSRSDIRDQP